MQKIKIHVGPIGETYVLAITTAPMASDGFGTFTVRDIGRNANRPELTDRMILIPEGQMEWQTMRNSSGLHPTWTEEEDNPYCGTEARHVCALLMERLKNKKE